MWSQFALYYRILFKMKDNIFMQIKLWINKTETWFTSTIFCFFNLIFIIFFPLPFSPLIPHPQAVTTLLSMSRSPVPYFESYIENILAIPEIQWEWRLEGGSSFKILVWTLSETWLQGLRIWMLQAERNNSISWIKYP